MIENLLGICQGPNDFGFLAGLKKRLACPAALENSLKNPALRRRNRDLLANDIRRVMAVYNSTPRALIVRLTDSDESPFREVVRKEQSRFPPGAEAFLICGACQPDVEHWLTIDPQYAAEQLGFEAGQLPSERKQRSGFIKNRIQISSGSFTPSDYVESLVFGAPPATFARWLRDDSFAHFYGECVRVAKSHDCPVHDERGGQTR